MENTVELYFDGVLKTCELKPDRNGEYLFESADGRFVKFPKDCDLSEAIAKHNEANSDEVEAIPEVVYGEVTTFDSEGNVVK